MKHSDYYNMMVQVSGLIKTDDNGNSICTICHGVGKHFEASVKHHKGCAFIKAIKSMEDIMPDKITLQVENSITLGMMLPYLANIEAVNMDRISEYVDCMKEAESVEERNHVAAIIQAWCFCAKDEILEAVVEHGLPDDKAEETFKNYLIFEWCNEAQLLHLAVETLAFENSKAAFYPKFKALLCEKYPHYAQSSKKD